MGVKRERIGDCELWLGNNENVMLRVRDNVEAILTDPPYGIGYVHGAEKRRHGSRHNEKPIIGDDRPFDPTPWLAWPCVLWGANHYARHIPPAAGRWLVWDKRDGVGFNDQSDVEIAWASGPRRADRIVSHLWSGYSRASERGVPRSHPTQKPIFIMEWSLGFLPESASVLDPFMGSGTTLVACAKLGRKGIGIEIDADYFDIACKRVEEAYRQPDLFVPSPAAPKQEILL